MGNKRCADSFGYSMGEFAFIAIPASAQLPHRGGFGRFNDFFTHILPLARG